ncbi:MAG: 3-dehydroquinate synthase [Clostridia bacterium]|nr:3-dehydroquinate synthase [Clostridia bacterium]
MSKDITQQDFLMQARAEINEVDKQMASLFVRRMKAAERIAVYKEEHALPILDAAREAEVIANNANRMLTLTDDADVCNYYLNFIRNNMALSRAYQHTVMSKAAMHVGVGNYDVFIERGALDQAGKLFSVDRKVLIVTDSGVPTEYAVRVAKQCREAHVVTVPEGEGSKSVATLQVLLDVMLKNNFARTDCVVAVGGGVVGDLAGFAASVFMRGIDFYNIPTTVLSQVDSSIGGKVAVNFGGVKNIVGAFYQPRAVLIDPNVLSTLPKRQIANGLAEAIKMGLTSDSELFAIFERGEAIEKIDTVIERSLRIKKSIVEYDEKESDLRRIHNFGHTLGHGIEAASGGELYHGECVALGMLPMCAPELRARLIAILQSLGLPTKIEGDLETILNFTTHDKKCEGDRINAIFVDAVGSSRSEKMPLADWKAYIREQIGGKP